MISLCFMQGIDILCWNFDNLKNIKLTLRNAQEASRTPVATHGQIS
jgi:hypothetical protein